MVRICRPRVLEQNICPLPVSRHTFLAISRKLGLPPIFLRAICRLIPMSTRGKSTSNADHDVLILRTNLSLKWQYALAVCYDASNNQTLAVLFGMQGSEIEAVSGSLCKSRVPVGSLPLLVPCLLMDLAMDYVAIDAEQRRTSLTSIRYETGLHGFDRNHSLPLGRIDDSQDDLDLDIITQKLTSLQDACAGIQAVVNTQNRYIACLKEYGSVTQTTDTHEILVRLGYLSDLLDGIQSKISYTAESTQSQVQTMFTFIGQKDMKEQARATEASRRIADDSRTVAILTRRDSTDMRIIAAVTLIFLPATFTTLFSTTFFDFLPGESTSLVSPYIWLYWLVTTILTVIVLSSWALLSRVQKRKIAAAVRRESQRELELSKRYGPAASDAIQQQWERAGQFELRERARGYLGSFMVIDDAARIAPGIHPTSTQGSKLAGFKRPDRIETRDLSPTRSGW
ncbi:hypothetical protein P152DRAFT_137967 [Eremomyces bilateralis CBS 781.70]|uniref:Uncharacterized protein n=1 Tax=Eremomyces bilateralis CBS 781.70 TaxID=1392243 RepID=A0A6G1FWG8_9PEZI|nr:uncharacterized protein P152DRAFT_137967 [Eremomyces bilateralis CBS 781.70]KAF1810031.1 hypothetical protein P152DRAFT_137967 [Eremomyces bilateralis CBS 781.70]